MSGWVDGWCGIIAALGGGVVLIVYSFTRRMPRATASRWLAKSAHIDNIALTIPVSSNTISYSIALGRGSSL